MTVCWLSVWSKIRSNSVRNRSVDNLGSLTGCASGVLLLWHTYFRKWATLWQPSAVLTNYRTHISVVPDIVTRKQYFSIKFSICSHLFALLMWTTSSPGVLDSNCTFASLHFVIVEPASSSFKFIRRNKYLNNFSLFSSWKTLVCFWCWYRTRDYRFFAEHKWNSFYQELH